MWTPVSDVTQDPLVGLPSQTHQWTFIYFLVCNETDLEKTDHTWHLEGRRACCWMLLRDNKGLERDGMPIAAITAKQTEDFSAFTTSVCTKGHSAMFI